MCASCGHANSILPLIYDGANIEYTNRVHQLPFIDLVWFCANGKHIICDFDLKECLFIRNEYNWFLFHTFMISILLQPIAEFSLRYAC
jgi:hypothetical protein